MYPLVDLFAGPGGLGEGFASLPTSSSANSYAFRTAISIEKDVIAHQTLQLRHFFRQFPRGAAPNEYYQYLENRISLDELYAWYPDEAGRAGETAWQCTLGEEPRENVRERIEAAVNGHRKWVLVGGPPCQVYSLAGRSSMKGVADFDKDPRHTLYKEYLRIIIDHQPPVFVMENVKGLISSRRYGHYVINDILRDLNTPRLYDDDADSGLRYRLYSLSQSGVMSLDANPKAFVVKAEEYGIPQARHRIFLVGIRSDIAIEPRILAKIDTPVTVRDVIGGLPCIRSGISRSEDSETLWRDTLCQVMEQDWFVRTGDIALSDIRQRVEEVLSSMPIGVQAKSSNHYTPPKVFQDWFTDKRLTVLLSHDARSHMQSDLHRYLFASVFAQLRMSPPKLKDFPEELLPKHKNVQQYEEDYVFSDRFRVQLPDSPATTIMSHISKDGHYYIHFDPQQCRSLTVREAARIQTFPDNYKFEGNRTAQYHQIGNAVPPLLAAKIAEIILEVLEGIE